MEVGAVEIGAVEVGAVEVGEDCNACTTIAQQFNQSGGVVNKIT